jgi:flagella synthesis protein FlgN
MALRAELIGLLQREHSAARAFTELLNQEREALVAGAVDRLAALADIKAGAARDIAAITSQRQRQVERLGCEASAPSISRFLESHPDCAVHAAWHELVEAATEARELNRTNGLMIATWLQHNQSALAALRSGAAGDTLYGATGESLTSAAARSLAQA